MYVCSGEMPHGAVCTLCSYAWHTEDGWCPSRSPRDVWEWELACLVPTFSDSAGTNQPPPPQRLDLRVLFSWGMRMGRAAQLYGEIPEQTPWLLTEQLTFSPFGPSLPGPPLVPGSPLRPCREWA